MFSGFYDPFKHHFDLELAKYLVLNLMINILKRSFENHVHVYIVYGSMYTCISKNNNLLTSYYKFGRTVTVGIHRGN